MKSIGRLLIAILASVFLVACSNSSNSPLSNLPVMSMKIGTKTYQLEIATDEPSQQKGLMERDSLDRDHGMLFVFDHPAEQKFWMHHTRFPLDIIFAGADEKIVSIHTMKAYDENNTLSNGIVEYAIEISAGEIAANGVKPGDQLQIPQAAVKK